LIPYRCKTIKEYIQGLFNLELGSVEGEMTQYLIDDFEYLTSVDCSRDLLEVMPTYKSEKKFNTINLEHIFGAC